MNAAAAIVSEEQSTHPAWCVLGELGEACGLAHMAEPVDVPAGLGGKRDAQKVSVFATTTDTGAPSVTLGAGPAGEDVEAEMTPAEARRLAAVLLAEAERAEEWAGRQP